MMKDGTSKDVAFARSTESIPFIEEYKYSYSLHAMATSKSHLVLMQTYNGVLSVIIQFSYRTMLTTMRLMMKILLMNKMRKKKSQIN